MADPEKSFIEKINIIAANIDQLTAYQIAVNNGFVGTEAEWLLSIKGADGANGADGAAGMNGADGLSTYQIAVNNGFAGTEAEWLLSIKGADGANGADGAAGADGANGLSNYQIAVNNGFAGTEAEWLLSIKGEKGADGTMTFADLTPEQILSLKGDIGETGASGANGESAYQVAVNNGFTGTEAEWIASLNGTDGADGANGTNGLSAYQVAVNNGYVGTEAEWIASLGREDKVVDMGIGTEINLALGNVFTKTITEATVLSISGMLPSPSTNEFILELTNGGAYPVTLFSVDIGWTRNIQPTLTISGLDILGFYSVDGGVTWRGLTLSEDHR